MVQRRNISPEWHAITDAQARQIDEARRKDAAHREMMLDAMRGLDFAAVCETFAGHVMGRPDATPEQKHDALQDMTRLAYGAGGAFEGEEKR